MADVSLVEERNGSFSLARFTQRVGGWTIRRHTDASESHARVAMSVSLIICASSDPHELSTLV